MNAPGGRRTAALLASLTLALATLAAATPAHASAAREVLDESAKKHGTATWHDRTLDLTIESRSGDSVSRVREAQVEESNDPGGGHRTFMEFVGPADVQGTLYLHLQPADGEEQEWLYSPQARRPRRVTPGQSDETSTGAELGYRAVAALTRALAWTDASADATLRGDETLDGRACRVVRVVPRDATRGAGYDVWIGADDLLVHKLVPLGGEPPLPKEILLGEYETIAGHATPRVIDVVGPDGAWRTIFRLADIHYDKGLGDGAFSLSRLNRGR